MKKIVLRELKWGGFLLFILFPFILNAQVSGVIFRDFNANGTQEVAMEPGLSGVLVKATNPSGVNLTVTYTGGGTATNGTGQYSIPSGIAGQVRVEFVLPDDYTFASNGANGGATIMFPTTATQNLAVNYPADYCDDNPSISVPCYVFGNLTTFGEYPTFVSDLFTTRVPIGGNINHDRMLGSQAQTGAVYGNAYARQTGKSYLSAFYKRYVGFGPGNNRPNGSTGAIYEVDTLGNIAVLIDLPESEMGANPHPNSVDFQKDPSWWETGKIAWGDIDISDDGKTLFAMNLYNRKLYEIDIATKTVINSTIIPGLAGGVAFTGPTADNDKDLRPFGLKYYKGKVYVGIVCTAESEFETSIYEGKNDHLQGFVFSFTPAGNFDATPVLNFRLGGDPSVYTYLSGIGFYNYGYQMWMPESYFTNNSGDWTDYRIAGAFSKAVIADIDFINGDMVVGIRDLTKDLSAAQDGTFFPDGVTPVSSSTGTGGSNGRVLKACANGSGGFTIENNGQCGGVNGYNSTHFYLQGIQHYPPGDQMGSIGVVPNQQTIVSNTQPGAMVGAIAFTSETTKSFDLATGINTIYSYDFSLPSNNPLFGKANGLGDIEVQCSLQPIEIGNRIWEDTDKDGIQDAGEDGIDGVVIELYEGTAATGSPVQTVTSATIGGQKGMWYFTDLKPNTDYFIKVKTALGSGSLATFTSYSPTNAGTELIDNNTATGTISLKTGNAGENNHSYDIGVVSCIRPVAFATPKTQTICVGSTVTAYTATPSTGVEYKWYGPLADTTSSLGTAISGATNASYTPTGTALTTAGTKYYAVVANTTGDAACTDTAFVQVVVNAKPNIANGSATICAGESVNLTTQITNYGTYLSPVWTLTTAGGTAVATPTSVKPTSTTTYVLVAQNASGCKDTAQVVVTVNAKPSAGTDQTLACANPSTNMLATSTTLVPSPSGGTWSQLGTTPATATINGNNVTGMNVVGTYQFVYSLNGCKDTVSVTVQACAGCVKPNAGADAASVCQPTKTAKLTAVTSGGTWSVIGSPSNPSAATIDASGNISGLNAAGTYRFVYSVTSGGQTCTDTAQVEVKAKPSAGADILSSNAICTTVGTAQLSGSPSGGTWSQLGTSPSVATITPSGSVSGMTSVGIYQFIYSLNGCIDTVAVETKSCVAPEVDLALKKSINKKIAKLGDTLTYTIQVFNQSSTGATGVEVVDSIATTVGFIPGSFVASRGSATITNNVIKWIIGNIGAHGDTVRLIYKVKAISEGIHFNTAEISKVNEKDVDSTPGNGKESEDDIDGACFSVPLQLCVGQKLEVTVPSRYTNVVWYKEGSATAIATGNVVLLGEVGTYTFSASNQTCPAGGCCPVIIEEGTNCCPTDICIPFMIQKQKKK